MTIDIKHQFHSDKGDGPDTTLVKPSDWNAGHTIELTGPSFLGRSDDSHGPADEIPIGTGLKLDDNGLSVTIGGTPIGAILQFAGSSAPAKWLLCYGQAISRTTYSALYAVIGTAFGNGNGSSTFNLPDCRGRVAAGKDNMGGTASGRLSNSATGGVNGNTLGGTGGAQMHVITVDQMPAHEHTGTTDAGGVHWHFMFSSKLNADSTPTLGAGDPPAQSNDTSGNSSYRMQGDTASDAVATLGVTSDAPTHTHDFTTSSTEGDNGHAHNNVQPTIIFNTIIYAGV